MRSRKSPACLGVVLLALMSAPVAGATSTPASSQVHTLKHVGISWATYASTGNAPKACQLQVEQNVGGMPCDQLPTYYESIYCPAYPDEASWRDAAERVVKVTVKGNTGSLIIRAASKKSKLSGKASFSKVQGKWRIASFQSGGRKFIPASLIFTEGKDLRAALWPLHC